MKILKINNKKKIIIIKKIKNKNNFQKILL